MSTPSDISLTVEMIHDAEIGGFTARLPDIPVYGEGATEEAAISDLKEGLIGYIETFGLDDAKRRLCTVVLRHIKLDLSDLSHG